MADDHDPRAPRSVQRRDDDQDPSVTSPLRTEPPSVPTRVHVQGRRPAAPAPAVIPLARRRAPRLGPRSSGTPAPSGPEQPDTSEAGATPNPPAAPPTAPTTRLPSSTGSPTGVGGDETPTTRTPVPDDAGAHLPTTEVPASPAGGPAPTAADGSPGQLPTERLRTPGSPTAGPRRPPGPAAGAAAGAAVAGAAAAGLRRPAARPTAPASTARPTAGAAGRPTAAAPGAAPSGTSAAATGPAGTRTAGAAPTSTTAAVPSTDPPGAATRTAAVVRTPDPEWAATSTVFSGLGTRLATLRRTWTWLRTGKLVAAMTAVMVLATTGMAWAGLTGLVREIGALDPDSSAIRDAAAQKGDQNFLIVGSDTRAGTAPDEDAGDAADVPGARSDTVMVVHVPEDRSRVTVVSFPRDLEIDRPACEHWDPVSTQYTPQVTPRTPDVKLNSAYAAGGPRCVTKVVQELSGLAINHFLAVDFEGFKAMVDAVHGVSICTERPIRDGILGTVIPRAGTSVLTGDQALNFVRARHVIGDPTSDYGRIQRQQRFLSSLLRTTMSAGTLLDPGKLQDLVAAVGRSTFGQNVGADQLLALGQSLGDLSPATVTFTTVPTTGVANSRGNEVLRDAADRDLFGAIIDNRPLPGQAPPPPPPGTPGVPPPPPLVPQQVTTQLVDSRSSTKLSSSSADSSGGSSGGSSDDASDDSSSGSGGSGGRSDMSSTAVAAKLRAEGFTVVPSTTGIVPGARTTIRFSPDRGPAAVLLGRSVPGAALDPSATTPGTLVLTLGDDFDGDVGATAAAQNAAPVVPTITAADARCS